ncbi:MAG TPA: type II toxin-antitoxin system VapC family toxin [Pirellulales bacterium]|nr:type II toxin-antitoxin system VapC family toxin [Pirellulales bacterium]
MATVHGVIHGKTIELNEAIALPDGQRVVVQVQPEPEPPPKRAKEVSNLLKSVVPLDATIDVAVKFGEVQAELMDRGLSAPDLDLMIAATALVHGYTVVTHNASDFTNVPGLNVVDWLVP